MIMIPWKWVPYVLIFLGAFGMIAVAVRYDRADKLYVMLFLLLYVIGGIIWAAIDIRKRRR